jgi:toxin-antitoxin system PIN domain toxin
VIIPDINLLIYAYDESSGFHKKAKPWLSKLLDGQEEVVFPLVSLLGFIRISTNPKIFERPLAPAKACELANSWLATPQAAVLSPTNKHFGVLHTLFVKSQAGSSLTTDAHIAALAIEYHGIIHSNDRDFGRFEGVRCVNPLR